MLLIVQNAKNSPFYQVQVECPGCDVMNPIKTKWLYIMTCVWSISQLAREV